MSGLHFLVHPELLNSVREVDQSYFHSLLLDLAERAKLHPDALFQQLCSLAVGPLIAREVGSHFGSYSELLSLYAEFVPA